MNPITTKQMRILAVSLSSRGFGFAVLEGEGVMVDWGIKTSKKEKNVESLAKARKLIAHYQPGVLVLEDASAKHSRRAPRIQKLTKRIIAMAATQQVKVKLFSREKMMKAFFADGQGTKHTLAGIIAKRFPAELGNRLPSKRRAWESEDCRMDIFGAVALALVYLQSKTKPNLLGN